MPVAENGRVPRRGSGKKSHKSRGAGPPSVPESDPPKAAASPLVLGFLLFASGAAALVYQLLWIKQLSLIVGIEVYAITTAVSAFFAGLAVGGAVFGRLADRTPRPLQLYARIEFAVAASATAAALILARAAAPFAALENKISVLAWIPLFVLI